MDTRRAYLIDKPYADATTEKAFREYWAGYSDAHILLGNHAFIGDTPYRVHTVRQQSGLYALHTFRQEGRKELRHTRRHVQQNPDEDYRLFVHLKGEPILVRQNGDEAIVGPGSASLVTQTHPFDMRVGNYSGLVLRLPQREIDDRVNGNGPIQAAFDIHTGLGRIITDALRGLYEERANITHQEFNATCDRLVELLCMLVTGDDTPESRHWQEVETAARQYIRRHSSERELSLSAVASALGWSPRRVQEVMSRAGTSYRELVREERLSCARRMLAETAGKPVSISEIAARCGFASGNVLSTLFRERYGESPRDYRHRSLAP